MILLGTMSSSGIVSGGGGGGGGGGPIVITGAGYTGQTLTATADAGALQWQVDGVDVAGQTSSTYVVRAEDNGKSFTCVLDPAGAATVSNVLHHWIPSDTTTALWLDAADLTTITKSGTQVTSWADKSGNARHLTQSDSGFQNYHYVDHASAGGLSAIDLYNTRRWDTLPSFTKGELLLAISYKDGTDNGFDQPNYLIAGSGASNAKFIKGVHYGNALDSASGALSSQVFINGNTSGETAILGATGLPFSVLRFEFPSDTDAVSMFAATDVDTMGWKGACTEAIITPAALSPSDRIKFEGYLAHKNNINLVAGHAHELAPPNA